MREEGLLYDAQSGGFLHIYSNGGRLIIGKESCQREHAVPTIVIAQ